MYRSDKMLPLLIVTSITDRGCFERILGSKDKNLKSVGIEYQIIETDPTLSLPASLNTIVKTHRELLENTKYIMFIHQDIEFLEEDWGKKIVEICDGLPDFGYGGWQCSSQTSPPICFNGSGNPSDEERIKKPIPSETCDNSLIIIPSYLFLEHQFDESFIWYPFAEDYACWVQFIKKLKVYALPIKATHSYCIPHYKHGYKDISPEFGLETRSDYYSWLYHEWERLNRKWSDILGKTVWINTTISNCSRAGDEVSPYRITDKP